MCVVYRVKVAPQTQIVALWRLRELQSSTVCALWR